MVMEYKLKRKLYRKEQVHHDNHNKLDDRLDNLIYCNSVKEHFKYHPEIAIRMREKNPTLNMTTEWRNNISKAGKGKKRTLVQRMKYRISKLGIKNPNYKDGHTSKVTKSRIAEVNHKVVKVYELLETEDVYCMEVPGYNWFFANDVLVHNCNFCLINIVNRTSTNDVSSSDSNGMRFWSTNLILNEFDKLAKLGVQTIRISDEMFYLNKKYYEPLLKGLVERNYDLKLWSYARVDSVNEKYLELFNKAGMKWLALGIESANRKIRKEVIKGNYQDVDISDVVKEIRNHDINVIANYIVGLPEEDEKTMQETLDLALQLNTETINIYPCMALPGSPLYSQAIKESWELPKNYEGYSFLSYDTYPLRTKYLTAAEVLQFRDSAWQKYFTNPNYLNLVKTKFGEQAYNNVVEMSKIKLKRKLLEN